MAPKKKSKPNRKKPLHPTENVVLLGDECTIGKNKVAVGVGTKAVCQHCNREYKIISFASHLMRCQPAVIASGKDWEEVHEKIRNSRRVYEDKKNQDENYVRKKCYKRWEKLIENDYKKVRPTEIQKVAFFLDVCEDNPFYWKYEELTELGNDTVRQAFFDDVHSTLSDVLTAASTCLSFAMEEKHQFANLLDRFRVLQNLLRNLRDR